MVFDTLKKRLALSYNWQLHLWLGLIALTPLLVSLALWTDGSYSYLNVFGRNITLSTFCFFKALTGFKCPACGMTRSFIYMSHLNIAAAAKESISGIFVYFLCIFEAVYRLIRVHIDPLPGQKIFAIAEKIFLVIVSLAIIIYFVSQFIR
jgi:hypothetical protein